MSDPTTILIQRALSKLGFSPGPLDGLSGKRTKAALDAARLAGKEPDRALAALTASIEAEALHMPTLEEMQEFEPAFPLAWLKPLHSAISYAHIIPARLPMFLAQLAHESAGFKTLEEYASGAAYEGRADLGNVHPGDGKRYKGRGVIQLTGRANYARYGSLLKVHLEGEPSKAARPDIAFKIAALYWLDRNINAPTDLDDLETVTRKINGGLNGLKDRKLRLDKARVVFRPGDVAASAPPPVIEAPADETDDDTPTVIAQNPTLIPDVQHPPGALKRERQRDRLLTEPRTVLPGSPVPPPAPRGRVVEVPLTSHLDARFHRSPSPRPAIPQPAPSPAPTPEVIPMSDREERREERKEHREDRRERLVENMRVNRERRKLVRLEFRKHSAIWIDRYRDTLAGIVAAAIRAGLDEYTPDADDRKEARRAVLDSFVTVLLNGLARATTSSIKGRVRLIHNEALRNALLDAVEDTFCRLLKNAIQDVEIAKTASTAPLLTDRRPGEVTIAGAFADLLDGAPEVVEAPRRDPIIPNRSPSPVAGIPHAPAATSAADVIDVPVKA